MEGDLSKDSPGLGRVAVDYRKTQSQADIVLAPATLKETDHLVSALENGMSTPVYKRILLKLSGEALAAGQGFGVDNIRVHEIAAEIADVHQLGIQIAIVVGGGNFFRGVAEQAKEMDRVSADHMGMLATVINALALQDALEKQGV